MLTELFAERTRDCDDLKVFRDTKSGVIFIDEHYVGDAAYVEGATMTNYRRALAQDYFDAQRRYQTYLRFSVERSCVTLVVALVSFKLAAPTCSGVIRHRITGKFYSQYAIQFHLLHFATT